MRLSELNPTVGRLMICQADLKEAKEQNKKMYEALKIIRDSFWTEPSESKKHIELQNIAKSLLKELDNESRS